MKKVLLLTVALVLVASAAYSATIVGTGHDIRASIGATTTQVCVFCHTPHNANTATPVALWNHASTNATYTLYNSATVQGVIGQPAATSRICLSCHDGTVALNALINAPTDGTAGNNATIANGTARIGTNLQTHHPVSVTYVPGAAANQDAGLRTNTNAAVVNGNTRLPLFGTAAPFSVECGSCHNVHDDTNRPFLRASNASSAMCTTCHLK